MMNNVFVIRHKPTGTFMAQITTRRGYSFIEVDAFRTELVFARFFHKKTAAQSALRAWLRGPWNPIYEESDWDRARVQVGAEPPTIPPANRRPEEMEIVSYQLVEPELLKEAAYLLWSISDRVIADLEERKKITQLVFKLQVTQ